MELSESGLFVQTDATTTPGTEIDLHLAASGAVPDLVLRAVVVRRRMVPAPLVTAVRRGIALEILEAPREYGLACGSAPLDAPIHLSRRGGGFGDAPAAQESAPGPQPAVGAPRQEPPQSPAAEAPPAPQPLEPGDSGADGPPRPEVLLVDDGSLGDVEALLRDLGADVRRLQLGSAGGAQPFVRPGRMFITTARLACSLHLPDPGDGEDEVVAIAVAEDESQTLSTMMRRLGFQYLVHRPSHPDAFRLLLRNILYRGAEHRRAERLPFGREVQWRAGWRKRRAVMVEISSHGCRLQCDRSVGPDSQVHIWIPAEATGARRIRLRGRVVRRDHGSGKAPYASHQIAVAFAPPPRRIRRRLDALLAHLERGPATITRVQSAAPQETATPLPAPPPAREPEIEATPAASSSDGDRRRQPRARLDREIVALDETGTRALHALVGRDLSAHGMRVEPHPELALGQRLRLALYEPSVAEPVVLEAVVARDDGGAGLALRFPDLPPDVASQLVRIVAALPAMESLLPAPERIVLGELLRDRTAA